MNEIDIIDANDVIVCQQCGALVLKSLKTMHGTAHSTFGSFEDVPSDLLVTYTSPEDLAHFKKEEE